MTWGATPEYRPPRRDHPRGISSGRGVRVVLVGLFAMAGWTACSPSRSEPRAAETGRPFGSTSGFVTEGGTASARSSGSPLGRDHPAPWPAASHDRRHTGTSSHPGPTTGRTRWVRDLGGDATPGPAVGADGTIYAAANSGMLHALDPRDGSDRWVFDGGGFYGGDLSATPAILRDGTVLWPGPNSSLYALSPAGTLLWKTMFGGRPLSPAVAEDESVAYVMDSSANLVSFDPHTGARAWSVDLGSTSYSSPVIAPDGTVISAADNRVFAVGADSARRWSYRVGDIVETSPAVSADGTVVVGTNDRWQYGLKPNGTLRWRYPRNSLSYSSAVAPPNGLAYFGDHRGFVTAVDAASGRPVARVLGLGRTRTRRSVGVWTAPALDNQGRVYFGTRAGHVYGFAADGTRLFDVDTGASVSSYPALTADGALVIGSANGRLFAIADG